MADIKIAAVLLDLGGVVFVGDRLVPGAGEAVARLRAAGLPLRFLTNTTRRSVRRLVADLEAIGLDLAADEILPPAQLARSHRVARDLKPHLLVHENLEKEFADPSQDEEAREAVVIGDARERFGYATLNAAFRKPLTAAEFLRTARRISQIAVQRV